MSADLLHDKKLLAWLAEPWDLVFWPLEQRPEGRQRWRAKVLQIFNLTEDAELLTAIEQKIRQLEGFADISAPAGDFCPRPTFIHPLSGEPLLMPEWECLAGKHEAIRKTICDVLKLVANSAKGPEDQFLALWRLAPELLKQQERTASAAVKLGASWDLTPAFDFAPYITVWQRNAAASALSAALPEPGFLSFRLGGAQEFIDRARTTEDYWAGSYLIAYLTWKAAEVVAAELGPDAIVFPSLFAQPLVDLWLRRRPCFNHGPLAVPEPSKEDRMTGSFPNGLLAIVPCGDGEAVQALAGRVAKGFTKEWDCACDSVKQGLEQALSLKNTSYWNKLWARQTPADRVFELFWTVTPWPQQASYREIFSRASRDMETRKILRDFRGEPEPNIKCHQCGLREALQDFDGFDRNRSRTLWRALAGLTGELEYRFRERERLCAVCTTRRLAVRLYFRQKHPELGLRMAFPSTSSVAATPYLRKILESAAELEKPAVELWHALTALGVPTLQESPFQRLEDEWRQQDPQAAWWLFLHMDGDWWFEQTYDSERLQADFGNRFAGKAAQIEQAREKLREFRKALEQKSIAGPPNYFAILVADGDRVGDWIRGDDLLPQWSESLHPALRRVAPPGRRPASLLTHLALSQCLGNLPRFLRPVIESEFDGALVYAGGDELLAFVPVARLAAGMQAYTETFSKSYEVQHGGYWLLPGKKFTASAAAFVVRHTDPLQGAVQEAHALLEGEAKENYGRQAGVIAVRRQSGQTTVMGTKWNPLAVSAAPFALLQELADCLATKQASPRFISHVAELGRGLVAVPSPDALQKMFEAILRRAAGEAASQGKAVLQGLSALLCGYNNLLYVLPRDSVGKLEFHPWKQLENALLVARFLARRG